MATASAAAADAAARSWGRSRCDGARRRVCCSRAADRRAQPRSKAALAAAPDECWSALVAPARAWAGWAQDKGRRSWHAAPTPARAPAPAAERPARAAPPGPSRQCRPVRRRARGGANRSCRQQAVVVEPSASRPRGPFDKQRREVGRSPRRPKAILRPPCSRRLCDRRSGPPVTRRLALGGRRVQSCSHDFKRCRQGHWRHHGVGRCAGCRAHAHPGVEHARLANERPGR